MAIGQFETFFGHLQRDIRTDRHAQLFQPVVLDHARDHLVFYEPLGAGRSVGYGDARPTGQ